MSFLSKYISKYTGGLRSLKMIYVVNNFLNRKKLAHNKELYKKYGIQKSIFSSIGQQDFDQSVEQGIPWLDRPDAKTRLVAHPDYQRFDEATQQQIHQFIDEGYMIFKGFYTSKACDQADDVIQQLLKGQRTDYNYTGKKIMNAYQHSEMINQQFFRNQKLLKILNFVMGKSVVPFQTINFVQGSEQRAHSDSIHMSTQPLGYLIASWLALEDIDMDSGPLFYYPGSHRMDYVSCEDYAAGNTRWKIGENSYKKYEDYIDSVIKDRGLKKSYFLAEKGDLLIWHANLLHGGDPISSSEKTRKSMVAHYFCRDVICYHEITQRPALIAER